MKSEEKKIPFTRKNIVFDLKRQVMRYAVIACTLPLVLVLFILILFRFGYPSGFSDIDSLFDWVALGIIFSLLLFSVILATYWIYRLVSPIKYKIANGTYDYKYVGSYGNRSVFGISGNSILSFKGIGVFPLMLDNWWKYYTWSKVPMTGFEIESHITQGDEFYIILVKNKIEYIYNKQVFEFKERKSVFVFLLLFLF